MSQTRCMVCAALLGFLLSCPPAVMAAATRGGEPGETLAVVFWTSPDFSSLLPVRDACWLLTHSQDMAVLLLPPGFKAPGELKVELVQLDPLRRPAVLWLRDLCFRCDRIARTVGRVMGCLVFTRLRVHGSLLR